MVDGDKPKVHAGQLTLDGQELRPVSVYERPYACCAKALVLTPSSCVCFFQSYCPEHGHRHNGTHD